MSHATGGVGAGGVGNVGGVNAAVGGVSGVGGQGTLGGVGGVGSALGGVNSLGGVAGVGGVGGAAPAPAAAPSTQGADMKRAYEALGIACPTSVSNMVGGGFPRAPLTRMAVPRPPALTDVVPQQPQSMQQLFAHQNQPDLQQQQQQQQQLVSLVCVTRHS